MTDDTVRRERAERNIADPRFDGTHATWTGMRDAYLAGAREEAARAAKRARDIAGFMTSEDPDNGLSLILNDLASEIEVGGA